MNADNDGTRGAMQWNHEGKYICVVLKSWVVVCKAQAKALKPR